MMKKILMMMLLCMGWAACSGGNKQQDTPLPQKAKDVVEVLYFHGKQRCATCMAIEREAKAVVEEQFSNSVKNGQLNFRVVDITKVENEALANQYEITWSSLVVVQHKNGKEQVENLTQFAFANARTKPEIFRRGLADKIKELLP